MNKQLLIFASWAVITAASLGFAVKPPEVSEAGGQAIAKLTGRSGTVQVRREGATLWVDVGARQLFQDGTLIATGSESTAKVAFLDGREIILGESSQVILTTADDSRDSIVTLLKGSVRSGETKVNPKALGKRRLVINSGDKSVALAARDDRVALEKKIGTDTPTIDTLGGVPLVATQASIDATGPTLPVEKLATSEILPEPLPETPLPTESQGDQLAVATPADGKATGDSSESRDADEGSSLKQAAYVPRLINPAPGARLWTTRSLAKGGSPLTLALAGDLAKGQVGAAVELLRGDQAVREVKVQLRDGRLVARLGRDAIAQGAVRGKNARSTLSLRAKLLTPSDDADDPSGVGQPIEIELASLADLPKGGASVFVSSVAPAAGDGWFPERGSVSAASAAAGVHLQSSADVVRLAPLLRGAGKFSVLPRSAAPKSASATKIIRSGRLLAQVWPDTSGASRYVRQVLGGDIAYGGPLDAYLGSGKTLAASRNDDRRWQAATRLTLVDQEAGSVLLNRALLEQQPGAWDVVAGGARAIFSEPVKILDPPVTVGLGGEGDVKTARARAGAKLTVDVPNLRVPKRLIFVEGMSDAGEPEFLSLDHRKFNALGVLTAASSGQSAFALSLNAATLHELAKSKGTSRQTASALRAMLLAEADAVVLSPRDGSPWTIARAVDGALEKVASAPAPGQPNDAAAVHSWLLSTLGLKDRLVGTSGRAGLVLAASKTKVGTQGIAVLGGGARAIVEVVDVVDGRSGQVAIVKLVLSTGESHVVPAGARIQWE